MILPPSTLGMLGGGQLGRFFVAAAHEMGYRVWVLDPDPHSPAGLIADRHLATAYDDYAALDELAQHCAAVSTEFENVPAGTLDYLAKFVPVRPSAAAVGVCQNRVAEKTFLRDHGLPHGDFAVIRNEQDVRDARAVLFPGILKVARFGYDGKGQAVVADHAEAIAAFQRFKGEVCVLEQKLTLDYEVSVVLARDENGRMRCFPSAENSHRNGILDVSLAPARASTCLRENAAESVEKIAEKIAERLNYVGILGVEFFVVRGQLVVNEMAPRPHNSGHYTLDACVTSQYEQQVRVLCGLPLGEPRAHSAAAMVNLLGDLWYDGEIYREPDWAKLYAFPNLKLHLYAKHHARPGRKMGHFTVLDADLAKAHEIALAARAAIGVASNE
jgi:5-(carboxyamino)imidazole ribonucleotide synthase